MKYGKEKQFRKNSIGLKAELICKPDENGVFGKITRDEFSSAGLPLGNGSPGWLRSDGKSSLFVKYKIKLEKDGVKIISIWSEGFQDNPNTQRSYIPSETKERIKNSICDVLATGKPEADHMNAYDCSGELDSEFQPLSKPANCAKRQHCKKCRETGKRFDARLLHFPVGWIVGESVHTKQPDVCKGCYWHSPKMFVQETTKNYKQ